MDTTDLKTAQRNEADTRKMESPWLERIREWAAGCDAKRTRVTTREIWMEAMGGTDKEYGRNAQTEIRRCMETLEGWTYKSMRHGSHVYRGYERKAPLFVGPDLLKELW